MSTAMTHPTISFPAGFDVQRESEIPARGYLSGVIVLADDGARYQLFFYDPVRLEQDLAAEGRGYLAEPNMIVLPEVTVENIQMAVRELWHEGFFQNLKPL